MVCAIDAPVARRVDGWSAVASGDGWGWDLRLALLDALGTHIDPRGLLLAGIVIGSLGVLDDVTVTQVSAPSDEPHQNDFYQRLREVLDIEGAAARVEQALETA